MDTGTLYVCATPIGNLSDISYRAIECLKNSDVIAAEDTRNTLRLLNHFEIKNTLTSYHEYNKYDKAYEIIEMLKEGKNVAVVTDAGTPGISDPGEVLVRLAHEEGIKVTPIPGPSAVITALCASGMPTAQFVFEAFLPKKKKDQKIVLERLKLETRTIILYSAPHDLKQTLKTLMETLGDRELTICRELTKIHEEFNITTFSEALSHYEETDPRGEYVLVIKGLTQDDADNQMEHFWDDMTIEEHVEYHISNGLSKKDAIKQVAKERDVPKREIYNQVMT
ncbi:MAG: 16S rRNA (cytidine(1402)-2'-O)-methyltransferase [Lachnospiraceae bacterium]|nr:16S rRNA (cytidine(1402)-2'-O)-methyltransferase [Lachnospiraceae bacterium]